MAMGLADDDSKIFNLDESLWNVDDDSMRDDAVRAADAGGDEVKFVDADGNDALLLFDNNDTDMQQQQGDDFDNDSVNVTNAHSIDMDESAHDELLDDSRVPLTPIRKPPTHGSAVPSPSVSTTTTPSMMATSRPRGAATTATSAAAAAAAATSSSSTTTSATKQTPASIVRRRTPMLTSRAPPAASTMHYSSVAVDRNEQTCLENAEQMQLNLAKVYFDLKVCMETFFFFIFNFFFFFE